MFMLRLLAALSWSDGSLGEDEAAALQRLIDASDLDDDERATARGWLAASVDLDTDHIASLSENQRLASYQAALRMAVADDQILPAERAFLDRVRDALGLSPGQASELEAELPKHG
jgi:uncharacterized membrane protein YebE (DUF533 family)